MSRPDMFLVRGFLVTSSCQVCLYYIDLYDLSNGSTVFDTTILVMQALGFAWIALPLVYFLYPAMMIPAKVLLAGYGIVVISIGLWRFLYAVMLEKRMFTRSALVIGEGELAAKITLEIEDKNDSGFTILAFAGTETSLFYNPRSLPCLPNWSDLCRGVKDLTRIACFW